MDNRELAAGTKDELLQSYFFNLKSSSPSSVWPR